MYLEMGKKSPKKPRHNAAGQEEGSSSARDIVRQPQSSQYEIEEMDGAEALVVEETELTRNDDDQGLVDCPENSAVMELKQPKLDLKVSDNSENPASDDAQGSINDAAGKYTSLTEPMAREADQEPEQKLDASEEQAAKGSMSVDEPGTDNPEMGKKPPKKPGHNAAGQEEVSSSARDTVRQRQSSQDEMEEMDGAEALVVEESELTHNDDGQGLVDCPENSAVMELKQPKLDLKVSDNSENPASDDAQGGINDASGKHASLTEPMAREADQEPEQKLDVSEEQAAKGSTSVDEPGTDNLGEESGAPNLRVVTTYCSGKRSCCVVSDKGDVVMDEDKLLKVCARALLELRDGKNSHQALAEKAGAIELKEPKLDHEVPDNSVVMQEGEQKVDLVAPAPSDTSEEERSDIIDGQENQTA